MSGWFVGFFLGTFTVPPLIRRVDHVRAFAFHAALGATAVQVYPLWVDPMGWAALRRVTGIALVGLCTVVESWLNAQAAPQHRSGVFGVFGVVMVVTLLAVAGGQLLLDTQPPGRFVLSAWWPSCFRLPPATSCSERQRRCRTNDGLSPPAL